MTRIWKRGAAALVVGAVAIGVFGAGGGPAVAGAQVPETDGSRLYRTYCASCHGTGGQGNGPMAGILRHAPSNLTMIAASNGGVFPSARVHRIIDGRDVESHGVPEMPVWGDAFRRTSDGSDQAVQARIAALVKHLETMQRRNAH